MRNYKKEREDYHSKPEQMVRNAARKRARRWMEKEGKAKAGDGKDVHHKDNNPLNNDKNNLSLVTQHYNRREPRLREEDVLEGALDKTEGQYFRNKVAQIIQISGRNDTAGLETKIMYQSSDAMRKSTRAFQLHFQKQRSSSVRELIAKAINKAMDKKDIFKVWDAPFAKMITAFGEDVRVSEDMGTVTGPHIAGTGDDSSTVKVRKRKKVRRRKTENRLSPSMKDWEKRQQLSRQVRQKF